MKMYFRLLLILCFLCCLPACQDKDFTFHEWNADLAMKKAQEKQQAVFLFVYQDEDDPYVKVFFDEIFQDEQIATFFEQHFVNVSLKVDASGKSDRADQWNGLLETYGVRQYPSLLLLTPQATLITDISGLGNLGYDASGHLPCRSPLLRYARLAHRFLTLDDSSFFTPDNWSDIDQINMRLDSDMFHRVASNGEYLRNAYGKEWDMMIDYTMAAASIRLMIYEKDKPARVNEVRAKAYYSAIDRYELPLEARYRLYADVNIAYGLGDISKARQIAYQAFKDGVIQESEYLQFNAKL